MSPRTRRVSNFYLTACANLQNVFEAMDQFMLFQVCQTPYARRESAELVHPFKPVFVARAP